MEDDVKLMVKEKGANKDGGMVSVATKCDSEKCHIDNREDAEKLKCKNCEKLHHYICTNLPAYQVYMFAEGAVTGNNGYTCEQCVVIPPEVSTIFDFASRQKNRQDAEIESLKEELNSRDEKISGLKSHILKLETEQPNSKKRCILKDDMNEVMIEDSANKTIEIERLKKENKLLKTKETDQKYQPQIEALQKTVHDKNREVLDLQKKNESLSLKQIELERHTKDTIKVGDANKIEEQTNKISRLERKIQELTDGKDEHDEDDTDKRTKKRKRDVSGVHSMLNVSMTEDSSNKDKDSKIPEKDFFDKVSALIENKMKIFENRFDAMEKKMEHKDNDQNRSLYSDAVTNSKSSNKQEVVSNFRGIALAAKIEDMNEENDKKNRENNLIIRGKQDISEEDDTAFVKDLIKELCIGAIHPTSIMRIGTKTTERTRPIKVTFKTSEDKYKMLNNLKALKGKEFYKSISVTHDFTLNEREMLNNFLRQAKEKNDMDTSENKDYKWKVWGSPKNRLFLKKVKMT